MTDFNEYFMENRPYQCEACGGKMLYKGGGEYECRDCGGAAWDDFGKVKAFLEEYGTQPALVISEATGVPMEVLRELLREGRLQLPADSKIFLSCEKCGCAIRSGRYCSECAMQTFRGIKGLLEEDAAGKKNGKGVGGTKARMRYLG